MRKYRLWTFMALVYLGLCLGAVLSTLNGCGRLKGAQGEPGPAVVGPVGASGASCTVEQLECGAKISCTDGTTAEIPCGNDGLAGKDGLDGAAGENGVDGQNGTSCTQIAVSASNIPNDPAQYGGSQITCGGSSVLITNGSPGVAGQAGTPGQSFTAQNLCPGTTQYPGTFVEVAFCLGADLYAVYWDSANAWLTLVPPGNYRSTSTTTPCNFIVSPGCIVTPN